MLAIDVELIADIFTDHQKQEIVTRVADALQGSGSVRAEQIKWVVIARDDRTSRSASRVGVGRTPPAVRRAFIDYRTWYARIAGSDRHTPTDAQTPTQ